MTTNTLLQKPIEEKKEQLWRTVELYAKSIIETSRGPLVTLNKQMTVIWANRSFCEMFQLASESIVGKDLRALSDGGWNIPELQIILEKILNEKVPIEGYQLRHDFSPIGEMSLLINARAITSDFDGDDLILLGVEDITATEDTHERLKASEIRYRKLFETAKDGIMILDANSGKIVDVNPFLKEMMGYTHEWFIGKELWEIGLFDDIHESQQAFVELKKNGYIRYEGLPLRTISGKAISVEFVSNMYLVGETKVIQCNVREITMRKQAEQELKNQLAKDEALLASIGDGILATDKNGKITMINPQAEKLLAISAAEIMGTSISTTLSLENEKADIIPVHERPVYVALHTGKQKISTEAYYYARKDGMRVPVTLNASPIILYGRVVGAVQVIHDATQDLKMDKAKTELISLVSHQLRTPPTGIKWYVEMLLDEDVGQINPMQRKYLEEVLYNTQRMIDSVTAMLNMSRIELGTFTTQFELTDTTKLLENVLVEIRHQVKEKELTVNKVLHPSLVPLMLDPTLVQLIMQNLITNAVKYTGKNGSVTIMMEAANNEFRLSVKDTGYGIPLDDQDKVFTKLFRAENARRMDSTGTGLGLYITKSIVNSLNGSIRFVSTEGEGTEFFIALPVGKILKPFFLSNKKNAL